jgi:aerobic-type carbon monoxide dehydrogenase small subunit (CoxS/CutS family)
MNLIINNNIVEITDAQLNKKMIDFLREDMDLTGTKNGCNIGVCGTCTILADDVPVKACMKTVGDFMNKRITTIEGIILSDGSLHPLQQSFIDAGAIQCGFCIPGMVLTAHAFLLKNNNPTRDQIRQAIRGNLCRCTGYQQIIDAIENAAKYY